MKTLACIDLGTNTFHLLIVETTDQGFREIYRKRIYVILAENGIQTIGPAPYRRALAAIDAFSGAIAKHNPSQLKIIGTEAMRTASNGQQLITHIQDELSVTPEIISGRREAELIMKGTSLIVDLNMGNNLIMDIGGGSVEFILVKEGKIQFMQSYKIGVSVLFNKYHHQDPISTKELETLEAYLEEVLTPVSSQLKELDSFNLIGASGSYEVLQSVIEKEIKSDSCSEFSISTFLVLYKQLIKSSVNERLQIEGMPANRVELIVVAFALIKHIVDHDQCQKIIVSPYALKEGVLSELI